MAQLSDDVASANKKLILDLLAAADRGDHEAIASMFADDYVDHAAGGSRPGSDKDAMLAAFREIGSAFPATQHEVLALIAEGDLVVLRTRVTSRHVGAYRGVEATGRDIVMVSTAIYRVADGRIQERWCDGVEAIADRLRDTKAEPTAAPLVVRGQDPTWEHDRSGARFWSVGLDRVSFTYFEVGPETVFAEHEHDAEQITLVLEGYLDFDIDGDTVRLGPGDAIALPSRMSHAVRSGSAGAIAVDAWSPPQDHLGDR